MERSVILQEPEEVTTALVEERQRARSPDSHYRQTQSRARHQSPSKRRCSDKEKERDRSANGLAPLERTLEEAEEDIQHYDDTYGRRPQDEVADETAQRMEEKDLWQLLQENERNVREARNVWLRRAPVAALPHEIIAMIFAYIHDQPTFAALALVCQAFNICATPLLYRAPQFQTTFQWAQFVQTLRGSANGKRDLGAFVQAIDLSSTVMKKTVVEAEEGNRRNRVNPGHLHGGLAQQVWTHHINVNNTSDRDGTNNDEETEYVAFVPGTGVALMPAGIHQVVRQGSVSSLEGTIRSNSRRTNVAPALGGAGASSQSIVNATQAPIQQTGLPHQSENEVEPLSSAVYPASQSTAGPSGDGQSRLDRAIQQMHSTVNISDDLINACGGSSDAGLNSGSAILDLARAHNVTGESSSGAFADDHTDAIPGMSIGNSTRRDSTATSTQIPVDYDTINRRTPEPIRFHLLTSSLTSLAERCPNLLYLNIANSPMSDDTLVVETGEYISSMAQRAQDLLNRDLNHPSENCDDGDPDDYGHDHYAQNLLERKFSGTYRRPCPSASLTLRTIDVAYCMHALATKCPHLLSVDFRGADWLMINHVTILARSAKNLRACNLVKCNKLPTTLAKLWYFKTHTNVWVVPHADEAVGGSAGAAEADQTSDDCETAEGLTLLEKMLPWPQANTLYSLMHGTMVEALRSNSTS
ncbi:uncharacterized protein EV422DRAFT_318906 [Fimicolochytrium jonesii]|uniref:uncharacterized protein n=1 Tax=Fimicolochytrium jonesii TaxID=1396493 RepID=UPI0022FE64D6|nr:uncharacterized protein EV422DRAFT_318906 [Fimicolochytrium jonesii]KAI8824385.1 hypothetical protein EV422DRAFT_318906 [Fimicolochytrium jonesii]